MYNFHCVIEDFRLYLMAICQCRSQVVSIALGDRDTLMSVDDTALLSIIMELSMKDVLSFFSLLLLLCIMA